MFLYVLENKLSNLRIGDKYFTSRVALDFKNENNIFKNRLNFFGQCFESADLFSTDFKSFSFYDAIYFDFAEDPEKKRLFITGCYCKKLNVTILVSELDLDNLNRQNVFFVKKLNEDICKNIDISFKSDDEPDEKTLKSDPFVELIYLEKYPSVIPRIMEAQKTHKEQGFLTVEQMVFIQWRLMLSKIEHQTNFFKVKVVHNSEHFPFKGINSWQFNKIYDYLDEHDQIMYGYLRTEYNKDIFNFLSKN